jgi:HEPN domain-containing protein
LPEWFLSEVTRITLISKRLAENRGPAFYGDEAAFTPPRNLYAKEDAEKAVSDAGDVLRICRNLFDWWKGSELHAQM